MTTLTFFTCFPRLPPELRTQIYKLALPGPRIITLLREPGSPSCTLEAKASDTDKLNALYYTCKESHNTMKTHYQSFLHRHVSTRYPVWMDISIDTLYVPDISVFDDLMRPNGKHKGLSKVDLGPIQHLALQLPVCSDWHGALSLDPDTIKWQFSAIKCFPELRKVTFVPRFVDLAKKYAEEFYSMFRNGYRWGDVFEVQDQYDPEVLGKLEFSVLDYEDFCCG